MLLASELLAELQREIEERGDFTIVVRSDESEYEPAKWTEFVEHDGDKCMLID